MESPLTTFLFVLMRDHLPAGTVRWLIEQSQLPGDPAYSVPELEALAERYAEELLTAPPRNAASSNGNGKVHVEPPEPPADPPPPDPPAEEETSTPEEGGREGAPPDPARVTERGGRLAIMDALESEALREWVGGEWMALADITRYVTYGMTNLRRNVQKLVKEGFIEARGHTSNRRYRSIREPSREVPSGRIGRPRKTSEPDHDDSGEGDKPADPEGDAEGGEQESGAIPGAIPARDDGGGQSGASAAAPVGSRARSAAEDDVELMARVGDYIKEQAPDPVYPAEIDTIFGLKAERRRRIIEMLAHRHRIEVHNANSPMVRYTYRAGTGMGAEFGGLDSPPPPSGLNLRPKPEEAPVEVDAEHLQQIRSWCRGQGSFNKRAAIETFQAIDPEEVVKILQALLREGILKIGEQPGIFTVTGWEPDYDTVGRPLGRGGETLEGKILSWVSGEVTADQAATHFGIPREEATIMLDRLVTESMVRRLPAPEGGSVYTPV